MDGPEMLTALLTGHQINAISVEFVGLQEHLRECPCFGGFAGDTCTDISCPANFANSTNCATCETERFGNDCADP